MSKHVRPLFTVYSLVAMLSSIVSYPFYYLTNLDELKTDDSLALASKAVQRIPQMSYGFNTEEVLHGAAVSVEQERSAYFILSEVNSIVVDSLVFQDKNGKELVGNEDYLVYPLISTMVIPSNYYQGYISNYKNEDNMKAVCNYINISPDFKIASIDNNELTSIINTKNSNFAIENGKLKRVFFSTTSSIESILTGDIIVDISGIADSAVKAQFNALNSATPSDGLVKLFLLDCYYDDRTMIAALKKEKDKEAYVIYVMEVIEVNGLSVKANGLSNQHGLGEIAQIGLKDDYLFVGMKGANAGLRILEKDASSYKDRGFNEVSINNIIDILVNKKSIYVINDVGLHIFDIEKMKYNRTKYIEHPHLKKLDYVPMSMNNTSPYFIGIAVDNSPPTYPEILIELIANEDTEFSPKLNKVFVTAKDINVDDIITDKHYAFTYIMDRLTSKMYLLTRGVSYIENTFSFVFDLSKRIAPASVRSISMISLQGDEKFPVIVIKLDSRTAVFMDFLLAPQFLMCYFNQVGTYKEIFTLQKDCSFWDGAKMVYQACPNKYVFDISVTPKTNIVGIWIGVVLCIACVIGIIVFLFCCRKCWNKPPQASKVQYEMGRTGSNAIENNQVKHKPMEEVEMDNKL